MSGYKSIVSFLPFILVIFYYACICSSLPTRSRTDFRTPRIVNGNPAEANDWTEENTKIGRKPFNLRTTTSKPNLKPDRFVQLENDNDRKKQALRPTTATPGEETDQKTSTEITSRFPSRLTKLQIFKMNKDNINESSLMKDEETQGKSKHRFSLKKQEITPIPSPILLENKSKVDVENESKELVVELHSGEEIGVEEETMDQETNNPSEKESEKEEKEATYTLENADHPEEEPVKEVNSAEEENLNSEELEDKAEETGKEKDIDSSQESEEKPKEREEDSDAEEDSLKEEVETSIITENEKHSNEFAEHEKESEDKKEVEEVEYESMGEEVVGDDEFEETSSEVEYRPFNVSDPKKLQDLLKKALEEISRRRLQFEMSKQETGNKNREKPNHDYTIQEFTQEVMRLGFSTKQLSLMKQCNQESSEVSGKAMMIEEADKNSIHRIVQRAWKTLLTDDEKRYQHVKEETSRGISALLENERRKLLELREMTEEELAML